MKKKCSEGHSFSFFVLLLVHWLVLLKTGDVNAERNERCKVNLVKKSIRKETKEQIIRSRWIMTFLGAKLFTCFVKAVI